MKLKTSQDECKRTFETAFDNSRPLRLQTRKDASRKTNDEKASPLKERFSSELVYRILDCIEEL